MMDRPPSPGSGTGRLAGLAADALAFVLDALALVRLGRALLTDVGRHLADQDLVDPGDQDLGRALGRKRDALGRRELDRVRVAELQDELLAVHVGAITGAGDLERLLEARVDAGDHVRQVGAHGAVDRGVRALVLGVLDDHRDVLTLPGQADARRQDHAQLALGALDLEGPAGLLQGDPGGEFDDLLAHSRHGGPLPDLRQELAAEARRAGLLVGHDSLRGREDGRAEPAEDPRDVRLLDVHPAAGGAHALEARDHALVLDRVLEVDAEDSLLGILDHLEVADVLLPQEKLRQLRLEARRGHVHLAVTGAHGVAHAGQEVGDGIGDGHACSSSFSFARPSHGPRASSSGSSRSLPAGLDDTRDLPRERKLPEADTAQAEVAQERARAAATAAPVVRADRELRLPLPLLDQRLLGHDSSRYPLRPGRHAGFLARALARAGRLAERHLEQSEQLAPLLVRLRRRDEGHVHAPHLLDPVVVDLREDDLLGQPERVVSPPVERARRHAAEVADAGDRDVDQPVVELPHPRVAQGHHAPDELALAQLEVRDRLLGLAHRRLLAGDRRQVARRRVEQLGVGDRLADAHVDDDLDQLRRLHPVRVAEALHQLGQDLVLVHLLEPRRSHRPGRAPGRLRRRGGTLGRCRGIPGGGGLGGLGGLRRLRLLLGRLGRLGGSLVVLLLLGHQAPRFFGQRQARWCRGRARMAAPPWGGRRLGADHVTAGARHALAALAVLALAHADAHALLRLRIPQGDLRDVQRRLLLEDSALLARTLRLLVALDQVHLLDGDRPLLAIDGEHAAEPRAAGVALRVPRQDDDRVALPDVEGPRRGLGLLLLLSHGGLLDHFRGQGDDLHDLLLAQLARDGSEDAGSLGLLVVVDQHHGVVVEPDVAAILAAAFLDRAHHDGLGHVTLLHGGSGDRVLHRHDHDVPHPAVAPAGATQDLDALRPSRARVVGHGEHRAKLDHRSLHGARPAAPTRRATSPARRTPRNASASPSTGVASP